MSVYGGGMMVLILHQPSLSPPVPVDWNTLHFNSLLDRIKGDYWEKSRDIFFLVELAHLCFPFYNKLPWWYMTVVSATHETEIGRIML
jgi:hypothetical protein